MTSTRKSLDELYSDDGSQSEASDAGAITGEAAPVAAEKADTVQQGAPPAPKETAAQAPTGFVPTAALEDERRKRQEAERKLQDSQREAPQQASERADPLIDPDAFQLQLEEERFNDRLELSKDVYVSRVGAEQFEAAEAAILQRAQADPKYAADIGLMIAKARVPAKVVWEHGQKLIEEAAERDPVKMRERRKAELQELLAELNGTETPTQVQASQIKRPTPRVPTSLAGVQSSGPRTAGPRPIARRSLKELYGS